MKHIGLIGSMAGNLPPTYCRIINNEVRLRRGFRHTATFTLHGCNDEELEGLLRTEDWGTLTDVFTIVARTLSSGGAHGLALCGSALNPIARDVGHAAEIPIISMGKAMTTTLRMFRYPQVVVAGTKTEREAVYWREELDEIQLLGLTAGERSWLRQLLEVEARSEPERFQPETNRLMSSLRKRGTRAVVLADPMLSRWINLEESLMPVFDVAEIHAWATAGWALVGEGQMISAPPCVIGDE